MFDRNEYYLLDFGNARRLERFGQFVLDRPCPATEGLAKGDPALWNQADARFVRTEGKDGEWTSDRPLPERWTITHGQVTLELKRTEFGHLGVFPEQAANWDWLAGQIRRVRETHQSISPTSSPTPATPETAPLRVFNLFAYTGASTLAAAAAGAEVVHVDAARNVVAWARRNAELSGLADAPVRWIAEDATKFVKRELRRGNKYHAVILDPPSYGHGPRGEVWRLSKHLPRLLAMCAELTAGRRRFLLVTCHTPQFDPARLERLVADTIGEGRTTAEHLVLQSSTGRELPSGVVVRWEAEDRS
ncbi:MAG TPA: class I SAM-dependent methyltransferase [Thermoguttaceae bacterium]|nr:class I SAM-dependent methyltransferase [Thermoguttaceae bacterium]